MRRRDSGQAIIEAVLLLVFIIGIAYMAKASLDKAEFLKKLVGGPWKAIASVTEAGTWSSEIDISKHPNSNSRWLTMRVNGTKDCQ